MPKPTELPGHVWIALEPDVRPGQSTEYAQQPQTRDDLEKWMLEYVYGNRVESVLEHANYTAEVTHIRELARRLWAQRTDERLPF